MSESKECRRVKFKDELPPVLERVVAFETNGRFFVYCREEGENEVPEYYDEWIRPKGKSFQMKAKEGLEACIGDGRCDECPYNGVEGCRDQMHRDARELIRAREISIRELQKENRRIGDIATKLYNELHPLPEGFNIFEDMQKKAEDDLK